MKANYPKTILGIVEYSYNTGDIKKADWYIDQLFESFTNWPEDFTEEDSERMFLWIEKIANKLYKR